MTNQQRSTMTQGDTLADILERVLETGVVVAGDIRVQVADIELLTIQIRLIICSVDRAQELGIDWWKNAPYLSSNADSERSPETAESSTSPEACESESSDEDASTEAKLERLDDRLARLEESIESIADNQ